ncbi:hypothetical protein GA0070606_5466 [Micromonospora citrea]|uniref:Uncharacterized protein n=1 Tax=Micromonospora citrea TaxID=47855 RepID=A0A1C6VWC0_9ACTN|nr:hypothetical protein GA0070606_5466 [Micromonospora citrea]
MAVTTGDGVLGLVVPDGREPSVADDAYRFAWILSGT